MNTEMNEQVWATLGEIHEVVIAETKKEVDSAEDSTPPLVVFCLEAHDGERHAVAMPQKAAGMFFKNEEGKSTLTRFIGECLDANHTTHKSFAAKFKAEIFAMLVVAEAWLAKVRQGEEHSAEGIRAAEHPAREEVLMAQLHHNTGTYVVIHEITRNPKGSATPRTVTLSPFPSFESAMQEQAGGSMAMPRKPANVNGGPTIH